MSNERLVQQIPYNSRQVPVGSYFCPYTVTTATFACTANRLVLIPIVISYDMVIRKLGFEVTTLHASNHVVGIYSWPRGTFADTVLLGQTAALSSSTTGLKEGDVTIHLTKGIYLIGINNGGTPTIRASALTTQKLFWMSAATATSEITFGQVIFTYTGTMPSTTGAPSFLTTTPPQLILKI